MKMRIDVGLSTTAKPNIEIKMDEIDGSETPEQLTKIREIAWKEFEINKDRMLQEYGKISMQTK